MVRSGKHVGIFIGRFKVNGHYKYRVAESTTFEDVGRVMHRDHNPGYFSVAGGYVIRRYKHF